MKMKSTMISNFSSAPARIAIHMTRTWRCSKLARKKRKQTKLVNVAERAGEKDKP
jgi:hypothetical protein